MKKMMTAAERVRICRLAEKIEKDKEYAKKIGVKIVNKPAKGD